MKKILVLISVICICLGLSSCVMNMTSSIDTTIVNTEINADGDLILYFSDGSSQNAGKIANHNTTVTVEGDGGDVSSAAAKGLMSAVSIVSNFVSKSGGGYYPGFGIIGGSGDEYYACGSGVIYRIAGDEALIITNHHVVYDSESKGRDGISQDIEIYLYGKENYGYAISAEYVGGSEYYDIAVLKAKSQAFKSGTVRAAEFDLGDVSVGERAIAVGNPQGYGISVSLGIVSVNSEYINVSDNLLDSQRAIRVDTAVNAGNSGGGLYNDKGQLIGIVNAKIVDASVENIGYAIPADVVLGVTENLVKNCLNSSNTSVKRAVIGINLALGSSSTVIDGEGNIRIVETVSVSSVNSGSLADGVLLPGDIILEARVGDRTKEITRTYHLIDIMLFAGAGDTLTLTIDRGNETITKTITITSSAITDR